jgi:hypothetical protein
VIAIAAVLATLCAGNARAEEPPAPAPAPTPAPPATPDPLPAPPATPAPTQGPYVTAPLTPAAAETGLDPELPIPTMEIDRLPPRSSYELAVQFGFGDIAYWREEVPPWIDIGVRGGWGRNFGQHRIGGELVGDVEGPFGVHMTLAAEPRLAWDYISGLQKGALLGFSVGPAFMFHAKAVPALPDETAFTVAPTVAARIGFSQGWSRVGRRFFFALEPRLRYSPTGDSEDQPFSPSVNLLIGSGRGA